MPPAMRNAGRPMPSAARKGSPARARAGGEREEQRRHADRVDDHEEGDEGRDQVFGHGRAQTKFTGAQIGLR
jgi:hypothetical protein